MNSNFLGSTSNLSRPSSGVEILLKEKNKEAMCKYIAGNDGKDILDLIDYTILKCSDMRKQIDNLFNMRIFAVCVPFDFLFQALTLKSAL